MSCHACGHDCCQGDCPPNQPLVYENCSLCGSREDYEDLRDGICRDCVASGFTIETIECHGCGTVLTQKDFDSGALPFEEKDLRGLKMMLCPGCAKKED